jgi:hypothetical protein
MSRVAAVGDWIKDEYRNDRSLGFVIAMDSETAMMLVRYPKIKKDVWVVHENRGHYRVI